MATRAFSPQFFAVTCGTVPPINLIARYTCSSRAHASVGTGTSVAKGELFVWRHMTPIKKITLDDRKRGGSVELAFNEETEKHFLSVAPSAEPITEEAFPLSGRAPLLHQQLRLILGESRSSFQTGLAPPTNAS